MNILMADGSVRSLSPSVSTPTCAVLVLPNDGLNPGNDW